MTQIRELYLEAANAAARLIAAPEVAAHWTEASALTGLSVGGLAAHLAGQIFFIPGVLAEPIPEEPAISLHEYYALSSWVGSDLDTPFNKGIRSSGEKEAADGPAALAERVRKCVDELRNTLPDVESRTVRRPTWGPYSIAFDDFVTSRMFEIIVHCDDLAYSVGLPTPEFPAPAVETVVDILSRIALRRHGAVDVLRALSRAERAPASVSAL